MMRRMVLDRLRECEAEFRKPGVDSLSLFGSVARDEENDASDIDLAVKFNQDIIPQGLAYFGFLDEKPGLSATSSIGGDFPKPTSADNDPPVRAGKH